MDAYYLCEAANDVPPAVSKWFYILSVLNGGCVLENFSPNILFQIITFLFIFYFSFLMQKKMFLFFYNSIFSGWLSEAQTLLGVFFPSKSRSSSWSGRGVTKIVTVLPSALGWKVHRLKLEDERYWKRNHSESTRHAHNPKPTSCHPLHPKGSEWKGKFKVCLLFHSL